MDSFEWVDLLVADKAQIVADLEDKRVVQQQLPVRRERR